jgi:hypothetical protein
MGERKYLRRTDLVKQEERQMELGVDQQSQRCPRCYHPVVVEPGTLGCCLNCADIVQNTERGLEAVDVAGLPPESDVLQMQASILDLQRATARRSNRWAGQH